MLGNESVAEGIATILENNHASGTQGWKPLVSCAGIIFDATGVVGALQQALSWGWQLSPIPNRGAFEKYSASM